MHNDIQKILVTKEEIQTRVQELGTILHEEYKDKNPLVVGVLKGCVVFFSDIIREMDVPLEMDFMVVSSYGLGTESTGYLKISKDLSTSAKGRHVIIMEDIIDTGHTLQKLMALLKDREAASIKTCTLLDKPERRAEGVTVKADWTGFVIPNEFVVGYGLDYAEQYRNLPYIGVLKPSVYGKR